MTKSWETSPSYTITDTNFDTPLPKHLLRQVFFR